MAAASADVLEDAHPLEQVEELEDDPDVSTPDERELVLALAGKRFTGEDDLAAGRRVESGDQVEQG